MIERGCSEESFTTTGCHSRREQHRENIS